MTLWDVRQARDEALDRVSTPSSAPWRSLAFDALLGVACNQPTVVSDDVWDELDRLGIPRPEEGRAMGPVMLRGIREGIIAPEGFQTGRNPRHHGDLMRTYRSLVYRRAA